MLTLKVDHIYIAVLLNDLIELAFNASCNICVNYQCPMHTCDRSIYFERNGLGDRAYCIYSDIVVYVCIRIIA